MYTVKMKPGGSGVEIVCAIFQKFFPGVGLLLENLAFWSFFEALAGPFVGMNSK